MVQHLGISQSHELLDQHGCGRLTVVAPPLEELVAAAVLFRLDTPEMADVLAGRAGVRPGCEVHGRADELGFLGPEAECGVTHLGVGARTVGEIAHQHRPLGFTVPPVHDRIRGDVALAL